MQSTVKRESHAVCGAKTRSGAPCTARPMPNGRCRMHGGKAGRPPKHGLYSKYLSDSVRKRYEEFLADEDLKDLRHEIARLRALLAGLDEEDPDAVRLVIHVCEAISRLVEKRNRIEEGERYVVSIENLGLIVNQVVMIVTRHIEDPVVREIIANELEQVALVERNEHA